MSESFTATAASASAASRHGGVAGPSASSSWASSLSVPAYPWYSVPRDPGDVDLIVVDGEVVVYFQEPIR